MQCMKNTLLGITFATHAIDKISKRLCNKIYKNNKNTTQQKLKQKY